MKRETFESEIDRRTICSFEDIPLLKFYENVFECVFVSLNPFLKINDTSQYNIDDFWTKEIVECSEKRRVLENTAPIKWTEILEISKLKNINQIDIALRTGILGLKKELENKEFLKELSQTIQPKNILTPSEGFFEENQQDNILRAIKKIGYEKIYIGSEFDGLVSIKSIANLIKSEESIREKNLYTEDKKILITVHWDSFQTYICSSRQNVENIVNDANLEGFYCDEKTEIYWSLR